MTEEKEPKNQSAEGKNQATSDEIETLKKQRDEYLAGWQRAKADFINYKKEELQRLQDVARYGTEEFIVELISVLDSFDLALNNLEKAGPVEKGIYMIRAQIEDVLRKKGLERITVAPGDSFDPKIAEVIREVESEKPAGTVVEEVEPGYRLYDRIIRPARVKISKEKEI